MSLVSFLLVRSILGDPARILLGIKVTPTAIAAIRARFGLDQPLAVQYFYFLKNALSGDFGKSIVYKVQVTGLIADHLAPTVFLLLYTVTKNEQGQAFDTLTQGDYDLSIQYWTNDIIDPDEKTAFSMYGDDTNKSLYTGYKNAEVTKLIDQSRVELDPAKRGEIYNKIQQIVRDEAQWVDLYYSPYRNTTASTVKNFTRNPLGGFTLEDTTMEK